MNRGKLAGTVIGTLLLLPAWSATAQAQGEDNNWHGEITPYLWAAGIQDSVTVGGHRADVDVSFNDLLDKTNVGGSVLGVLEKERFMFWGQVDYLDLSTDQVTGPLGGTGHVDSTATVGTLAVGYQFDGFKPDQKIPILVGARQLSLDNELNIDGVGKFKKDQTFTDAVLVARPDVPLSDGWRFNPTLSYGSGDSKVTWELWPQFQYTASKNLGVRIGYRRLYYDVKGDTGNRFQGAMHGFTLGLGYLF